MSCRALYSKPLVCGHDAGIPCLAHGKYADHSSRSFSSKGAKFSMRRAVIRPVKRAAVRMAVHARRRLWCGYRGTAGRVCTTEMRGVRSSAMTPFSLLEWRCIQPKKPKRIACVQTALGRGGKLGGGVETADACELGRRLASLPVARPMFVAQSCLSNLIAWHLRDISVLHRT